jgi:Xaa-Pro dipeptidase
MEMPEKGRYAYFSSEEYKERQQHASQLMDKYELDALIVMGPENLFYLTGYISWLKDDYDRSFLGVLPKGSEPVLLLPRLQLGDAEGFSYIEDIRLWRSNPVEFYVESIKDLGLDTKRIGLELGFDSHIWMSQMDLEKMKSLLPNVTWKDCAALMFECRRIKSPQEITYLRRASQITDKAVENAWNALRPGMLESELSAIIAKTFAEEGAQELGFIALRSTPDDFMMRNKLVTERELKVGDVISCDMGCVYRMYWSDMMRAASIGKPSPEIAKGFADALVVNTAVREAIRPGMEIDELDGVRAKTVEENGFGEWLPSIGHCIGSSCHESPGIRGGVHEILEPGMVFCVEPGVYYPPHVFNIEDVVLVTDDGAESLNNFQRELYITG